MYGYFAPGTGNADGGFATTRRFRLRRTDPGRAGGRRAEHVRTRPARGHAVGFAARTRASDKEFDVTRLSADRGADDAQRPREPLRAAAARIAARRFTTRAGQRMVGSSIPQPEYNDVSVGRDEYARAAPPAQHRDP